MTDTNIIALKLDSLKPLKELHVIAQLKCKPLKHYI